MQENLFFKLFKNKKLTATNYLFIAINLIPIWGVWFKNWDARIIFIIFCLETVIIGLYNILKIFTASIFSNKNEIVNNSKVPKLAVGLFIIAFFIFHFGLFVFVQMKIFLGVLSMNKMHIEMYDLFFNLRSTLPRYAQLLLLLFFISYGFGVIKEFVIPKQFKTVRLEKLMLEPYGRIITQQLVVIIGTFTLFINKDGKILILIFVLVKLYFEVFMDYKVFLKDSYKNKTTSL